MRDFDPNTPILFFSGAAREADKRRGIQAGATAYLVKPDVDGLGMDITQFVFQAKSASAQLI